MPHAALQLPRRMRPRANELGRCKGRLRVNSRPWEQPGRERARGQAGQLGPHSGARPAGQPPAGASRQTCGCPGRPAHSPTSPAASGFGQGKGGAILWLGPWSQHCDSLGSPGAQSAGGFRELGQLTASSRFRKYSALPHCGGWDNTARMVIRVPWAQQLLQPAPPKLSQRLWEVGRADASQGQSSLAQLTLVTG